MDDRTALDAVRSSNHSIESRIQHQGLSFLHSRVVDPLMQGIQASQDHEDPWEKTHETSEPPQFMPPPCYSGIETMRYYATRSQQDICLGDYLWKLFTESELPCQSSERGAVRCPIQMKNHLIRFSHGSARITVRMEDNEQEDEDDTVPPGLSPSDIRMWTACTQCRRRTIESSMSKETYQYSFAKYLEQIFYNPWFIPLTVSLCASCQDKFAPAEKKGLLLSRRPTETGITGLGRGRGRGRRGWEPSDVANILNQLGVNMEHRSSVVRCFQIQNKVFSFHYEPVALYQISLPPRIYSMGGQALHWTVVYQLQADFLRKLTERFWSDTKEHVSRVRKEMVRSLGSPPMMTSMTSMAVAIVAPANPSSKDQQRAVRETCDSFLKRLLEEESKSVQTLQVMDDEVQALEEGYLEEVRRKWDQSGATIRKPKHPTSATSLLRSVRETMHEKLAAVEREIRAWQRALEQRFPAASAAAESSGVDGRSLTEFMPCDLRPVRILPGGLEPTRLISFAISSKEVRDLLYLLEEVYETCREHTGGGGGDMADKMKRLWRDGNYPTVLSHQSPDGLELSEAKLVDDEHIQYRYVRYYASPEVRFRYALDMTKSTGSLAVGSSGNQPGSQPLMVEREILVTIYHAHSFHLLRTFFKIPFQSFVQSLSHCNSWTPTGGKSATRFFQSSDGRFVVKQMGLRRKRWWTGAGKKDDGTAAGGEEASTTTTTQGGTNTKGDDDDLVSNEEERKMILNVTPKYLAYLMDRVCGRGVESDGIPSLLVKVFGIYQVTYAGPAEEDVPGEKKLPALPTRSPSTPVHGKPSPTTVAADTHMELDMNLLVSEHLFHGRSVSMKFDLKGVRSRTVDTDPSAFRASSNTNEDRETTTLWDGNWLQSMHGRHKITTGDPKTEESSAGARGDGSALYLHPHARYLLQQALENDTDFFLGANIIDYSLLVGVDDANGQLVMGIVDFFCEYNLWKRLENTGKTTYKMLEQKVKALTAAAVADATHAAPAGTSTSGGSGVGGGGGGGSPTTEILSRPESESMRPKFYDLVTAAKKPGQTKLKPSVSVKALPPAPDRKPIATSMSLAPRATSTKVSFAPPSAAVVAIPLTHSSNHNNHAHPEVESSVTVQPPDKYRSRFLDAMHDYFVMVPDTFTDDSKWAHGQKKGHHQQEGSASEKRKLPSVL